MTDVTPTYDRFSLILRGLKNADRFAVGRRLLSVVALGALAERNEPGSWRELRRILHEPSFERGSSILLNMAAAVEKSDPGIARVFTQVLVNDALHSRSFAETLLGALSVLEEWLPLSDQVAFGRWFNAALDEASNSGPAIGDIATSRNVSELLIALADLKSGQSLYDPCSGLAGLLSLAEQQAGPLDIMGRDIHPISWALGSLRLHLLGSTATIEQGDSLDQRYRQYDRVVCDPPSGLYPDFRPGVLSRSVGSGGSRRYEGLFVDHCAASLKVGGRAVVLVNQGFLARRGFDEEIRRSLVRQGLIEGIVALPAGFSAWSPVELALLVLSNAHAPDRGVRMVDVARMDDWQRGRPRDFGDGVSALLEAYHSTEPGDFATTVPTESLYQTGLFRPAHYFSEDIVRRPVSDLLAEAAQYEAKAQVEANEISRLLTQLKLNQPPTARMKQN